MKSLISGRKSLFALAALLLIAGGWSVALRSTFEFQPQTKISIKGTSTMHDFECQAGLVAGMVEFGTDSATDAKEMLNGLQNVSVSVPVDRIACGNGTMDKKMREALQAGKAPLVKYTLSEASVVSGPDAEGYHALRTSGKLFLAGQERPIEMTVRGRQMADGRFLFSGSKDIKMSEWGIKAPTAMLGTMKTGDQVTVAFEVIAAN